MTHISTSPKWGITLLPSNTPLPNATFGKKASLVNVIIFTSRKMCQNIVLRKPGSCICQSLCRLMWQYCRMNIGIKNGGERGASSSGFLIRTLYLVSTEREMKTVLSGPCPAAGDGRYTNIQTNGEQMVSRSVARLNGERIQVLIQDICFIDKRFLHKEHNKEIIVVLGEGPVLCQTC